MLPSLWRTLHIPHMNLVLLLCVIYLSCFESVGVQAQKLAKMKYQSALLDEIEGRTYQAEVFSALKKYHVE